MVDSQKTFRFVNDSIFNKIKTNKPFRGREVTNINSVRSVPWVNKSIFEVRDHNFSYFFVRDSIFTKKRDLMTPDLQKKLTGERRLELLADNFVLVPALEAHQYILFNQKDFSFNRTLMYRSIKALPSCQAGGKQFLLVSNYDQHPNEHQFAIFKNQKDEMGDGVRIEEFFSLAPMVRHYQRLAKRHLLENHFKKGLTEKDFTSRYCVHEKSERLFFITNATLPMLAQNDLQQSLSKGQEQFMKIFTNAADFMDLDDNSRSSALTGTTVNVLVERLVSKDNHPRTFGWLFQCNEFPTESKDQL